MSPDLRTWAQPDFPPTLWWLMPGLILLAVAEVVQAVLYPNWDRRGQVRQVEPSADFAPRS